jgi:VWFA-related protein
MREFQMRLMVGCLVLAAMATPMVRGQDSAPAEGPKTITMMPNPVVLGVVVRDKKGALVDGLTKDDFVLQVKEKPQTIQSLTKATDQPLTLGLVVDVNRSLRDKMPSLLDDERAVAKVFLDTMLRPAEGTRAADSGFVVHFAKQIELLQDVTSDKNKLDKAIGELGTESAAFKTAVEADKVDSEGRKVRGGGTSLYDALFLSTDELMSKQKGRKVLVVLTDGVDVGSKDSLTEAIEAAQRADTTVYAVYVKVQQKFDQTLGNPQNRRSGGYPGGGYPGGGYPGGGGGYPGGYPGGGSPGNNPSGGNGTPGGTSRKPAVDGRQVLDRLCGATGGRAFELGKKQSMQDIYTQIADELRGGYQLIFTPDEAAARYGLHPIDLDLKDADKNKKMDIQTRAAYYGGETK